MRWRGPRRRPLRERPVPPCPLRAATRGRGHVSAAPVIAAESHAMTRIGSFECASVSWRGSANPGATSIMNAVKIKRVALCGHPVGGEVIVTDAPSLTSPAASLPFSLVEVLPLERLRFSEGSFRILHFLELLGDELHTRVHEVPNRRPNGLRSAREVVDFHEEIESLQIPRGQAQSDFFRVRIPQGRHPTRRSTRHALTDERRTE